MYLIIKSGIVQQADDDITSRSTSPMGRNDLNALSLGKLTHPGPHDTILLQDIGSICSLTQRVYKDYLPVLPSDFHISLQQILQSDSAACWEMDQERN